MKAKIEIENGSYGFDKTWTLVITKGDKVLNAFFLGQDVKFCRRVLGMDPSYIVEQIGSGEITVPAINRKLAKFIINTLELTESNIKSMHSWDLCAE